MQTPFEQAVEQYKAGTLQVPTIHYGAQGQVDPLRYQLAVSIYYLSLLSKGIHNRQVKLSNIKKMYGLKGRTADVCLPQLKAIQAKYAADNNIQNA